MALPVTRVQANPTVGGSSGTWGTELNTIIDELFAAINTDTVASLALKLDKTGGTLSGALTISSGGAAITGASSIDGLLTLSKGRRLKLSAETGSSVTPDLATASVFDYTVSGSSITINNPTNQATGQHFFIIISGSGGDTISWGTNFEFPATGDSADRPTSLVGSNEAVVECLVRASGNILSWAHGRNFSVG